MRVIVEDGAYGIPPCPPTPTAAQYWQSARELDGETKPHYPGATGMRNSLTLTATFIANYCQTAIGLVYFRGNENKTSDFPPPTTSCLT